MPAYPIFSRLLPGALMFALLVFGCTKESDDPIPTNGTIDFKVSNMVGNDTLRLGQLIYSNAAANPWQVDLLKYYVSNITLVQGDGTTHNVRNYDLIDEELPESKTIGAAGIPNGTYTAIRFFVGVDSARNNNLDQSGDLDPSYGMFWPWNTGYIFFKHEGYFQDSSGTLQPLLFHYGTDLSLVSVELPIQLTINGNHRTMELAFDLGAAYNSPNIIDFNVDNYHQSTFGSERTWIEAMKQNLSLAFRVTEIR